MSPENTLGELCLWSVGWKIFLILISLGEFESFERSPVAYALEVLTTKFLAELVALCCSA